MYNYQFYDPSQGKFKKGDLILIPFGEKTPSVYEVLSTRGKKLLVLVLEDSYKDPVKAGSIYDISKAIYEGYWCHRKISKTKPKLKTTIAKV